MPESTTGPFSPMKENMDAARKALMSEEEHSHHGKHHYMMSLSDITNKLHEEFSDEIEGANEYMDMAKSAASMHHYELALSSIHI